MTENSTPTRVLELRGLSCSFGGISALDGFDFDVFKGEILGIIGPNGAGKSVLINLITHFYAPSAGTMRFYGEPITRSSLMRTGRLGIARTFQNIRLFRRMTVLENVLVANPKHVRFPFRSVLRSSRAADRAEAVRFLKLMGLLKQADRLAGTLAYGDARRLEIARALAAHPKLLLLDEPAAGMNERETEQLAADIRAAAELVEAIMLVEHDMALIKALSTRVVALNAGRKICEGTAAEVLSNREVKTAYLGDESDP